MGLIGTWSLAVAGLAVTVAATQGAAQAPAPAAAAPTERWQVDGSNGLCTLIRMVAAPQQATLFLQTSPGTDEYSFAVSSKSFAPHPTDRPFPVSILLHDADSRFDKEATSARLGNDGGTLMRIQGLDEGFVQAFGHSTSVSIDQSGKSIGPYAYRGTGQAVQVFNACIQQLLTDWGADPAQFQAGGKRPVPLKKRDEWFTRNQMMDVMRSVDRRRGGAPEMMLRLTIATDGRVSACQDVDDKHGHPNLEKTACGMLLSQPLFEPARDPAGKPVVGAASYHLVLMGGRR